MSKNVYFLVLEDGRVRVLVGSRDRLVDVDLNVGVVGGVGIGEGNFVVGFSVIIIGDFDLGVGDVELGVFGVGSRV